VLSTPPLRLDEYVVPEVDLQAAGADAFAKLIRPPAEFTAFPAGHIKLDGQQAARLARIGMKPNWPDHQIVFPHPTVPDACKLIGIEWKKPGEELSRSRWVRTRKGKPRWIEGQREGFRALKAAGMRIYVCIKVEDALAILEAEGCPMIPWRVAA
jgi:hypothetical protein